MAYRLGYHRRANMVLDAPSSKQSVPHVKSLSPEGQHLLRRLRSQHESPAVALREHLEREQASTEIVRVCLEEYRARLTKHPRTARPRLIRQDKIGSLTLRWLWSQDMRWVTLMHQDIMFLTTLVYYLVAEELDEFVVGWIKAELPAGVSSMFSEDSVDRWRGQLLRALIGAHLDLAFGGSADRALQALFRVRDGVTETRKAMGQLRDRPRHGFGYTSLWPAIIRVNRAIFESKMHATDPRLFERFLDLVLSKNVKSRGVAKADVAMLRLRHPTKPDPDPYLTFLRKHIGDGPWVWTLLPSWTNGVNAKTKLLLCMETIIKLLGALGRQADLDWVIDGKDQLLAGAEPGTRGLFEFYAKELEEQWPFRERRWRAEGGGPAGGEVDNLVRRIPR